MIREALEFHLESLAEDGDPIPEPRISIADAMADHLAAIEEYAESDYGAAMFGDAPDALEVRFAYVEVAVPDAAAAPAAEAAAAAQSPSRSGG